MMTETLSAASLFGAQHEYNGDAPGDAGNVIRGLTRSSGTSREGLLVESTQEHRQPRQLEELTPDFIAGWASSYRYWTTYGISLGETEVGHPLPWARQVAKALEPKRDPDP